MQVIPIPAFSDNYIWVIPDYEAGVFDCVDPGEAEPVLHFAKSQQLKLRAILLTHHHNDHIGGVGGLIKHYPNCVVYGPNDSRIPYVTHHVKEQDIVTVGHLSFRVLFNPGHTSSHISYYEPNMGWLFCGDTLFCAGCGRVFDGTMQELHQSMQLFKSLPSSTKVFCAHEYTLQNLRFAQMVEPNNQEIKAYIKKLQGKSCTLPSSMDIEKMINPFLRTDVAEVQQFAKKHGARSNDSLEVFRVIREEKNRF